MRNALASLTDRQRAVLVLWVFGDVSEAQVADVLHCAVGTVKSTMARAVAKLRENPGIRRRWRSRADAHSGQAGRDRPYRRPASQQATKLPGLMVLMTRQSRFLPATHSSPMRPLPPPVGYAAYQRWTTRLNRATT